jgi:hypothetical protein
MNRLLTVLVAMIFGLIVLTVLCLATIFLAPDVPFNPLSPSRATVAAATRLAQAPTPAPPTQTPIPTYPPTWTPTATFTPAPTKTPSDTATVTPTKTPSSTPTATVTRTPTKVVVPTFTPYPPYPYAGTSGDSKRNCANLKLSYSVSGEDGEPAAGFQVAYGEIAKAGSYFVSELTRYSEIYGVTLIPGTDRSAVMEAHDWFAFLLKDGQKMSSALLFTTDPILADNPNYCDEVSPEEFQKHGCILNPCESEGAVNVKHIDFKPRVLHFMPVTTATPLPHLCSPPYDPYVIPRKCSDCATQADAQRLFEIVQGPEVDIYDFDRDGDGIACEELP